MLASFNGWYVEIGNHTLNRFKHLRYLYFLLFYFHRAKMFPLFCPSLITILSYFPVTVGFLKNSRVLKNQMNHYQKKKKIEVRDNLLLVWVTAT